jgi:hypothetical protein
MIWESTYWKEELFRQAEKLKKCQHQRRWSERSLARLEKIVMIGFYSIRKLVEAKLLSDAIRQMRLPVVKYRPTGKHVTFMNWHRPSELYTLDRPQNEEISLLRLCSIFIHSYTFLPLHNDRHGLEAILVNSDRTRTDGLLRVELNAMIDVMSLIAADDPRESRMVFHNVTDDYEVELW